MLFYILSHSYVMLCYVMLCYVMLYYVMLCYVCYVMLCYVMLCYKYVSDVLFFTNKSDAIIVNLCIFVHF